MTFRPHKTETIQTLPAGHGRSDLVGLLASGQRDSSACARSNSLRNPDDSFTVADAESRFVREPEVLDARAKDVLDGNANRLHNQNQQTAREASFFNMNGRARVESSEHLANSADRFLVEKHNGLVYRVRPPAFVNARSSQIKREVQNAGNPNFSNINNSLAALSLPGFFGGSPIGATQLLNLEPSPRNAASQPPARQQ